MIVTRSIFCLSIALTLFWGLGFAAEAVTGTEPAVWSCAVLAVALTTVFALLLFRVWPRFLGLRPGATGSFLRGVVLWTLVAYVFGVLVVGGAAMLLASRSPQGSEALRGETSQLAYMLALWLPLWVAPAIGLALGWWKVDRRTRSNLTIEADARKSRARLSS